MHFKVILGAALCTFFLWSALAIAYFMAPQVQDAPNLTIITTILVPLFLLLWGIFVPGSWRGPAFVWLRRFALFYAAAAGVVGVSACALLDPRGYSDLSLGWVSSLMTFAVLALAPNGSEPALISIYRRWLLVFSGAALGGSALAALLHIPLVVRKAEAAAQGRPYCLQVPVGGFDYEPVARLSELSISRMRSVAREHRRARRFEHSSFHAVLFVERLPEENVPGPRYDRLNWSYRYQKFMPVVGQGHIGLSSPQCEPSVHFLEHLPIR